MKNDKLRAFRIFLMMGDMIAVLSSYFLAYIFRIHLDSRPFYFAPNPYAFIASILILLPLVFLVIAMLGLYKKSIFYAKSKISEIGRLMIATAISSMAIITYDFFTDDNLFPVRIIALYSAAFCLLLLLVFRLAITYIYGIITKRKRINLRALIVGNSKSTEILSNYIATFPESGYKVCAIVSNRRYIPKDLLKYQYSSPKEAIKKAHPDVIFQTEEKQTNYIFQQSINHHLQYFFVPSEAALSSHIGEMELIGNLPVIAVKSTPLIGDAKLLKRVMDLVIGLAMLIVAAPIMAVVWIMIKLSDPKTKATYSEIRLTRYNKKFKIYKFRTIKAEYNGLSPEQAFIKMGKPELIKKYRKNGDYLKNDPRITKIGKVLRATSIDELPQILNVLKGDLSLVGPRALVPGELRHYGDRSLLLSVKSGLTGLAQVSGRRDISFTERRALDIYYIQNWSIKMDLQIIAKTAIEVIRAKGAK